MEVTIDRGRGEFKVDDICREQGLQFGGKEELTIIEVKVERLLPHPVSRQNQPLTADVPQDDRKHPPQLLDKRQAALLVEMQDHLAITLGRESASLLLQLLAEFNVVVDLTVGDQDETSILIVERLPPAHQINDAQSSHLQGDVAVRVLPFSIGTTMNHLTIHHRDLVLFPCRELKSADHP